MADDVPPDVHPDEVTPEPAEVRPDLGTAEPVASTPSVPLAPPPPPEAPLERKRSKAVPIAIGAAILAVIIAVVAIAVGGGKKSSRAAHPSASASVAPPSALTAIAQSFSITLNWAAPPGLAVTSYQLTRNGTFRSTVEAPATTYTDTAVTPGQTYTYDVLAQVGTRTSTKISVAVQTPVPALADARLDGHYKVKMKYLSQTGYITTPKPRTLEWLFTPLCATGACDVSWIDEVYTSIRATLRRTGTIYHGADHGFFGSGCSGKKTVDGLTVTIRVVAAKAVAGEWVPSKFVGTIIENDTPQLGCVGATGTITVTGTLSA
jgi:hypothetical protein